MWPLARMKFYVYFSGAREDKIALYIFSDPDEDKVTKIITLFSHALIIENYNIIFIAILVSVLDINPEGVKLA